MTKQSIALETQPHHSQFHQQVAAYSVSKKISPEDLRQFFQNSWEFCNQILQAYYVFLSTLDYEF